MNAIFLSMFLMAAAPAPDAIVKKVNDVLYPEQFKAQMEMTTRRTDGTEHTYKMELLKLGRTKNRLNFTYPPEQAGNQLLRSEDNMWMYLTNLKRSMRISSRQQLMGGDFNNGDLLRTNLVEDYTATLVAEDAESWTVELRAKSNEVTYDRILLKARKADGMPMEQKIFTLSGKHIKTLTYGEPKRYGKVMAPSQWIMQDELARGRRTVLTVHGIDTGVSLSGHLFTPAQLGR